MEASILYIALYWYLSLFMPSFPIHQVKLPPIVGQPRMCFSLECHNHSATESELVLFGGIHGSLSMDRYLSATYAISDATLLYLGITLHACVLLVFMVYACLVYSGHNNCSEVNHWIQCLRLLQV